MFHSVIIASKGRPHVLAETLDCLRQQISPADEVLVSVTIPGDLPNTRELINPVRVIFAHTGVTRQINAAIGLLDRRSEIVSIVDDDMELAPNYLGKVSEFFRRRADVVFFDGACIARGVADHTSARKILRANTEVSEHFFEGYAVWGCNMNVRRWALQYEMFDEALVSYGWLHELDFGHRVARHGIVGRYAGCRCVHLEVPGGRISGVEYGFAQIMNPVYFYSKGTVVRSLRDLIFGHVLKALAVNAYWLARGDKRVDRWGRLRGNARALTAALKGKTDPRTGEHLK